MLVGVLVDVAEAVASGLVARGVSVMLPKSGVGVAGTGFGAQNRNPRNMINNPTTKTASAVRRVMRTGGMSEVERFKCVHRGERCL